VVAAVTDEKSVPGADREPESVRAYLTLLVGVVAVSFAAVIIRLAGAPPMVIATYRMVIATAVMLPIASVKSFRGMKKLERRDWLLVLLSGACLALHFGLWITSLSHTSIAGSVVLVTSHPAFVAVISYFLWGERLNRLTICGIVLALAGMVVINYNGLSFSEDTVFGNLLALLAAFCMGAYLLVGGQVRERIDLLGYLALVYSVAAVLLLAVTLLMGCDLFGYSPATYLMMALLALVPQLIGHSSLNLAVRLVPVTLVSVAILGEPVGATLLGWLILGEMPTANEIIGGLLILGGIFIVLRRSPRRQAAGL
jgi:drug/metabolite transporter (DMT)-like permease